MDNLKTSNSAKKQEYQTVVIYADEWELKIHQDINRMSRLSKLWAKGYIDFIKESDNSGTHILVSIANNKAMEAGDVAVSEILSKYEVVEGNIKRFSPEQLKFVEFVAGRFEDLIEVMLIDERGYEDIWFVFPELNYEKSISIIRECNKYFRETEQKKLEYLLLMPDNIIYERHFPLIMLKIRGYGDA